MEYNRQTEFNKNISLSVRRLGSTFGSTKHLWHDTNDWSVEIRQIMEPLINSLSDACIKFVSLKEDFQLIDIICQCIKSQKEPATIYIVSELIDHSLLEILLSFIDDIEFEKYYAQSLDASTKRSFRMIPVPKLEVVIVKETQSAKKRKKKKRKSKQHDIIRLIAGRSTESMDSFENELLKSDPNGSDVFFIKGTGKNHTHSNHSIPVISYFDSIDYAFGRLLDVMHHLQFPSIQWFADYLLPQTLVAVSRIDREIFAGIYHRLYKKYMNDTASTDKTVKCVYIWIDICWNVLRQSQSFNIVQLRLPNVNSKQSIGIILDFFIMSLQNICDIKLANFRNSIVNLPLFYDLFDELIRNFVAVKYVLDTAFQSVLYEIIRFDPVKDAKRVQYILGTLDASLFARLCELELWKAQLDILLNLQAWKQKKNSSRSAIITISTWSILIDAQSEFTSLLKMIVGNDTIIQRNADIPDL